MFKKILIANRGEIAVRVIKSCKRMGIATVAVYSEADRDSLHVELADEAVAIGPAASAESYLRADRIIEAAKATGAEAIHPGFGFLSEKAGFVEALAEAGLVFIGPPAPAIAAMGDKIESKKLAAKAGVSTVPGHIGEIADAEEAVEIARGVGYPVMIKASAGGGGKGMRIARSDKEVAEGFRSARSEAKSSFGDDRVFIERYVEEPRHIEIQVLADAEKCLYLWERECSIQRRHQKVVEEAPSPFLDEATRRAMGEQAVALAQAVGYRSAGTVEFIVDRDRNFFFLEMNTRLQVEHPVTEMITGLDLVEWMIRIAAGETLPFSQKEVKRQGWAIETRVYAEDPTRGFLPSIGRLVHYAEPKAVEGVRVDSGVRAGAEISMYYDPMIAKLVTHGPDRETAIQRMRAALDAFHIRGIQHNVAFLSAVVGHPRFREGRLSTNFIAEEFPDGFVGSALQPDDLHRLVAVAAFVGWRREFRAAPPGQAVERVVFLDRTSHRVTIEGTTGDVVVRGEGFEREVRGSWAPGVPLFRGAVGSRALIVQVDGDEPGFRLTFEGASLRALVVAPRIGSLLELMPVKQPPDLSRFLLSPMPGLLVSLAVSEGQEVKAGEELAVVEAMKMENVLRAAADGRIAAIKASPGDSLAVDQAILEFE
ncbi:biotin carboxyl carrier protein /biotin carboxylase [Tistlia consotensis]|uniref:propionyl-CoA carboxylase n=1 Tax=Tistlia consotensis USBA 355 TaxID=560819 RepID=A0A1Y6C4R4_9PROT|nr:acetyl/propionyl/methylcrotonyl-CoA carboxylase subunit alpha [Tistlia consotensis]SMF43220.1 biotin carboxyl carrier protein /biotin carboxylase [Tistlia consotensis USBA 355]SNR42352.1 biotin carboxyl carrier protein /biotin carboxylase [Tistlia consotensis]